MSKNVTNLSLTEKHKIEVNGLLYSYMKGMVQFESRENEM